MGTHQLVDLDLRLHEVVHDLVHVSRLLLGEPLEVGEREHRKRAGGETVPIPHEIVRPRSTSAGQLLSAKSRASCCCLQLWLSIAR